MVVLPGLLAGEAPIKAAWLHRSNKSVWQSIQLAWPGSGVHAQYEGKLLLLRIHLVHGPAEQSTWVSLPAGASWHGE